MIAGDPRVYATVVAAVALFLATVLARHLLRERRGREAPRYPAQHAPGRQSKSKEWTP